jgi:hypothetical protein
MKTKIFKGFIAVFAISLVLQSCDKDFDKINSNPNEPSLELASPKMLLTNAIESMTDRVYEIFLGHEMGNCWVQHLAKVQYTDEDRYIPRVVVVNNTWTSFYSASGMDAATLYKIADAKGQDNYKGVALIIKSYITSVLTDLFGPVPNSQAWKAGAEDGGILSPAYDDQATIYAALIADLTEANTLLTGADDVEGDILYGGDVAAWRKFANTLRLRLLLRQSDRVDPTAAISAILDDPDTYPVFESNDDNAQLAYLGSFPNNNPIHENRKTRDDHRVSKTVTDLLWANSSYLDWRITIFADLDGNTDYEGMPNGLTSSKAAAYNGSGLKNTSKLGAYFSQPTAPGVLMSYSELLFIEAEAAHKGYITGEGDTEAGDYYTNAIYASYEQWGDDLLATAQGLDDTYGLGIIKPAWDADSLALDFLTNDSWSWDAANADELIGTQKWVAMFDQGLQSWFEWRRLNYPVLTPAEDGVNDGKIPVRVMYPSDEGARNPKNRDAGVELLGGADNLNTRVWWDTQDNF